MNSTPRSHSHCLRTLYTITFSTVCKGPMSRRRDLFTARECVFCSLETNSLNSQNGMDLRCECSRTGCLFSALLWSDFWCFILSVLIERCGTEIRLDLWIDEEWLCVKL